MSSRRNRRVNKKQEKKTMGETINETEIIDENNLTIQEIHNDQEKELEKCECFSDKILRLSYDCTIYFFDITCKTLQFTFKISGIYLLWICLHYIASHLYIKFCVPSTIFGFIMSPFMTATPHCLGLRWIVYNAANMINNMWLVLGTWICSTILIINHDRGSETNGTS
jgi:hypothetical protein